MNIYGLNPELIKAALPVIAEPLVSIINIIIETGHFPNALKLSRVVAIFKKGNKQNVEDYRPISMVPWFSKIIESILAKRITDYFISKNLFFPKQYGFQKKKIGL